MCQLFIQANADLWCSTTRSIRIEGLATSIRLENYFWSTLEEIAERDDINVPRMISRLYRESIEAKHDLGNFTSFLRVCCIRYLALQMSGDIPTDKNISIASLN